MKKIALLLIASLSVFSSIPCFAGSLIPVRNEKGQWGYMDSSDCSKYVIKPEYEDAYEFCEGLAVVKKNGKYGYIDGTGKMVISPQYSNAGNFQNKMAICSVERGGTAMVGVIDPQGEVLWPFTYKSLNRPDKADFFVAGMSDGKQQILGIYSKSVSSYDKVTIDQSKGIFTTVTAGKYNILDRRGEPVLEQSSDIPFSFNTNNESIVSINGDYGIIDRSGKFLIKPEYESCVPVLDYYEARVKGHPSTAIISRRKGTLSVSKYESIGSILPDNTRICKKGSTYGYIDKSGTENLFSSSKLLQVGNKYIFDEKKGLLTLDKQGVFPAVMSSDHFDLDGNIVSWSKGMDAFKYDIERNQYGVVVEGRYVWLPSGAEFVKVLRGFALYKSGKTVQAMDSSGKRQFTNYALTDIRHLYNDYYAISTNGKWLVCGKDGKVFPTEFKEIGNPDENAFNGYITFASNPGLYVLFPIQSDDVYYVPDHFNYNTYGTYLDLKSGLYGLVNKNGLSIKERARYSEEPEIPFGSEWLSGTFEYTYYYDYYDWIVTRLIIHPTGLQSGTVDKGVWRSDTERWHWDYGLKYQIIGSKLKIGNFYWDLEPDELTISANGEYYERVD